MMTFLTVRQPWAHLIAIGRKTLETRSWATAHRGPLAIHAGRRVDLAACRRWGIDPRTLRRGVIECVVDLVDCRRLTADDEAAAMCPCDGLYGFVLRDVRRIEADVPAVGRLGLWRAALALPGIRQEVTA